MSLSRPMPASTVADVEIRHINELKAMRLLRLRDLDQALERIRRAYLQEIQEGGS